MKLTMISDIKPYSAYKDSGDEWLGDVPTHWEVRRLRTLIRIINGATPASGEPRYWDGQITWITPEDLGKLSGVYVGESGRQITNEGYDACGTTLAPSGSLALSIRAPIGHLGLLTSSACVNQGCRLLVPGDAVRSSFLYHALRTARGELASLGQGTTFPELPASKLADLRITLPPLPEQAAIVRFLDHADRRIQRYIRAKQKLIALLEEQRKAATQEVIQSRSVTSNKIEVVADLVERPIHRVATDTYTPIGLYNRGRGIFKKEPRNGGELGDSDFFWVEEGDLVLSGQFAWEGAIALAGGTEFGCVASHRYPILQGRHNVLDSGFLLAFFQTDWGQLLLDHHSRGAAGRNRPLNARTLLKEKIPLPPLRNQMDIVKMLRREKMVRQQVEDSKRLLNEYQTRLISDVVTGKLDVREAAAELPEEDVHRDTEKSADEYAIETDVTV